MKTYRNRFGISFAVGDTVKCRHPRGGFIIGIIAKIAKEGGGVRVTLDSGMSFSPDAVTAT